MNDSLPPPLLRHPIRKALADAEKLGNLSLPLPGMTYFEGKWSFPLVLKPSNPQRSDLAFFGISFVSFFIIIMGMTS